MTKLQNNNNPTFGTIGSVWTSTGDNSLPNWGPPTSIDNEGTYGFSGYGYQDGPNYLPTYYAASGYLHSQTNSQTFTLPANTIYLMPFIPYATHSFFGCAAYVINGVAGAQIGMGIYGPIHSNLIASSNTGVLDASTSNTLVSFIYPTPVQLIGGTFYIVAIWGNNSATTLSGFAPNYTLLSGLGTLLPGVDVGIHGPWTDISNPFGGTMPSFLGSFTGSFPTSFGAPILWLGGQ